VDGMALLNMTENDFSLMFPGKIGITRKIVVLLSRLKKPEVTALAYEVIQICL
jgi:hypothetical protein